MKRHLLIIAVFLLLGAVVNVAVAWGCALWVPYSKTPELQLLGELPDQVSLYYVDQNLELQLAGELPSLVAFDVFQSFGSEYVHSALGDRAGYYTSSDDHVYLEWPRRADWSQGRTRGPMKHDWTSGIKAEEARGWPMLSLSWHYWVLRTFDESGDIDSVTRSLRFGWPLGGTRVVQTTREPILIFRDIDARILPYRPIWLGFTINTIFYATLLWLLIPGPFALRRFLRVRHGLCPKCAYPMGESAVCTECGCGVPKRASTT